MIDHRTIQRHFKSADPVLAKVIREVGPVTLRPERDRFRMLVRSIISQQISTAAARTIRERLEALILPERICPESIAALSLDQLREAGVSRQKAGYLLDLAEKCSDGSVRLSRLGRMTDERVIEELVQVKGIGRWSAQMFLIFAPRPAGRLSAGRSGSPQCHWANARWPRVFVKTPLPGNRRRLEALREHRQLVLLAVSGIGRPAKQELSEKITLASLKH